MLNFLKSAAKTVLSVFKPAPAPKSTAPGVTKPIGTIGPNGLQGSPNTVQQTANPQPATYNPQQPAKVTVQGSGAIKAVPLTVKPNAVAAQQQIDIQRALAAAAAAKKQQVLDTFTTTKNEWQSRIQAEVDRIKQRPAGGFFSNIWDSVTFGPERRASQARKFAQEQTARLSTDQIDRYDRRVKSFLSEQASRRAGIESSKFRSQGEYDRAVSSYRAWEDAQIKSLEYTRAATTGMLAGYGAKAVEKINTPAAKLAGWFGNSVIKPLSKSPIWQYTLGEGSKNIPSLVTAPSRVLNTVGNWLDPNRTIYQYGNKTITQKSANLNAWQASFNQRNTNLAPYQDTAYNEANIKKIINSGQIANSFVIVQRYKSAKSDKERQAILHKAWDDYQHDQRMQNNILEIVRDPLNLAAGAGAIARVAKGTKFLSKITDGLKATKLGGFVGAATDTARIAKATATAKLAQNPVTRWLGAEATTRKQQFYDAGRAASEAQRTAQAKFFPQLRRVDSSFLKSGAPQIDYDVLDELAKLSDSEAAVLQRMKNGKLAGRDRLFYAGRGLAPARAKLEDLAARYKNFTDQMAAADKVTAAGSRFIGGKKQYFANTSWIDSAADAANVGKEVGVSRYDFRKFKKHSNFIQNSAQLAQSQIHRLFKSDYEMEFARGQHAAAGSHAAERADLLKQYDDYLAPYKNSVQRAYNRTRSPLGRLQAFNGAYGPMALWKKSVLKYRPAWTVNNVLYNTQAAVLAGGPRALLEQGKMLNPRYWRKAMDESRGVYGGNLDREIGSGGRLNKFYSGVEDWSRVAAGRAAEAGGLSKAKSLRRVNRYLFDYKTRNWERPIKAVVPFWSFQKNLAKAAAVMPFDRPVAAQAYNRLDRYQQNQYDREFETLRPKLRSMGYSDSEIDNMKAQNAKYYQGKLKIGKKWFNTPFNAFSDKGLSSAGINPFLSAASEFALSEDSFGTTAKDNSFTRRLVSKFPQAELGLKAFLAHQVSTGKLKPIEGWIGGAGSEGYGLSKQRQGFLPGKSNYDARLDPRAKLEQDTGAFFGVPRSMEFDKSTFLQRKLMQKVKEEYFGTKWPDNFTARQAAQNKLFEKYGITADQFYKGELSKYDTQTTKDVKTLKEEARIKTAALYAEYFAQPKGQRNVWATQKLKSLVDSGYFDHNPFLKSFDWTNPATIAKAHRQVDYQVAKSSGDWSQWTKKYGTTAKNAARLLALKTGDWSAYAKKYGVKPSQKALAVQHALKTGDWSAYRAKYGTKPTAKSKFWSSYFATADKKVHLQMLLEHPEFAKNPEKIAAAAFWARYATSTASQRKQLLADNPKFNTRGDWTKAQWDAWRADQSGKQKQKLLGFAPAAAKYESNLAVNRSKATLVREHLTLKRRLPKIQYSM